jgi:FAD/FMN-containing dehydrogenase
MVLEKEIFKEFEEAVGKNNISDGEAITTAYAYNWCMEFFNYMQGEPTSPFSPTPKAVILPASTEEVQQVVKLCNKHRIKSTFH